MSVHYAVKATVFDISQTQPQNTDCFLVDSNVWLWMTYSKAGYGEPGWRSTLMTRYATFVSNAVSANSRVCCCALSLAELSHIIEKTEREIHEASTGIMVRAKEYRHNDTIERDRVVSEIQTVWAQVSSLADPLPITIDSPATELALNRLSTEKVDGYDLFILESMRSHGVRQIITDDGDFATVPDIQVFTANPNVIRAAQNQGLSSTR